METAVENRDWERENQETVSEIHRQMSFSEDIHEFLPGLIEDLKIIFDCEATTLFAVDSSTHQLYSTNSISDEISEIRVSISLKNLAGFVAGTGTSLNIFNVKDEAELSQYHPQLSHDSSWDDLLNFNTKSMIVVPIPFNKSLIGILQVINKKNKDNFSSEEFQLAKNLTPTLGIVLSRLKTEPVKQDAPESEEMDSASPEGNTDESENDLRDDSENISNDSTSFKQELEENESESSSNTNDQESLSEEEEPQVITVVKKDLVHDQAEKPVLENNPSLHFEEDNSSLCSSVISTVGEEPEEIDSDEPVDSDPIQVSAEETGIQAHDEDITAVGEEPEEMDSDEPVSSDPIQVSAEETGIGAHDEDITTVDEEPEEIDSDEPVDSDDIQISVEKTGIQAHDEDITAVDGGPEEIDSDEPVPSDHTQVSAEETGILANAEGVTLDDKESEEVCKDDDKFIKEDEKENKEKTLFGFLVDKNLITEKALASSISHAEKNNLDLESVLLQQVEIDRQNLGLSLANYYDLPYFGFRHSVALPQKAIGGLNKNFLAKNYWLPIKSSESKVVILINDPSNPDKLQNIRHIFSRKEIEFKVGLKIDIIEFLNSVLEQGEAQFEEFKTEKMSSLLSTLQESSNEEMAVTEDKDETEEIQTVKETDGAIIRLVNKILSDAYEREASDIHIEPGTGKDDILVRFRKEGECHSYEEIPAVYKQGIISRIKIMAHLDIAEKRLPQDGKFKARYGNKHVEFRVATCPTVGGNEDAVLRILASSKMAPLEKMNFSPKNLKLIKKTITKPYGLILVVGPTGSGKTTTLHSCLNEINTPKKKIWTAEDPVEITQKGLRQVQMLEKKGLNFARAMRSFLRGDPDVIMVGEMRDQETANIGLEASLTGHLVLSTLHTNSAPETITRLLDMGMNPLNFADSLLLIIAQRLVKTLCKECREDYHPSIEEFDILVDEYGKEDFQKLGIEYQNLKLKKPVGCHACENTGYAGRVAIHELLEGTASINRLIVKQATVEQLRVQAMQEGMTTLKQDGIQKVLKGDCDLKQILSVCMV